MNGDCERAEVVIVGAGLAGLATASLLSPSCSLVILEASGRCGGRIQTRSTKYSSAPVDLGAEYVGQYHSSVRQWCDRLGVSLTKRLRESSASLLPKTIILGNVRLGSRDIKKLNLELEGIVERVTSLSEKVDPVQPWKSPRHLADLNSVTVDQWLLSEGCSERLRSVFSDLRPGSQSMLALLSLVAGANGQAFFTDSEDFKLSGGAARLIEAVGHSIRGLVRLNSPVVKLGVQGRMVEVTVCRPGERQRSYRAQAVVVTTPSECWSRILGLEKLTPTCAPKMERNRLLSLMVDTKGRTTEVRTANVLTDGACRLIWCESEQGVDSIDFSHFRVLAGSFAGVSKLGRRNICYTALDILGIPSGDLMAAYERRWDRSPWSHGTYPVFGLGALSSDHSLVLGGSPPIFFAGDSIIPGYAGYMEGALRSAERIAGQIRSFLMKS